MNDIEKVKSEDWHIITVFKHLNAEEKELNYYYYYYYVVDGSRSFWVDHFMNRGPIYLGARAQMDYYWKNWIESIIDLEDIVAISREKFFTKENIRWTGDLYPLPNPLWIDKEKK